MKATVVWFRRDLRLEDNPALDHAFRLGAPIIPLYIDSTEDEGEWTPGEASRWWLHESLAAFQESLQLIGSRLVIRKGPVQPVLREICEENDVSTVLWNRLYEPKSITRDTAIKSDLIAQGIQVDSFNSQLLFEPWHIKTQEGNPYRVFTPFWKQILQMPEPARPTKAISQMTVPSKWPGTETVESLGLKPTRPWVKGLATIWEPGELGAKKCLGRFAAEHVASYPESRNRPDDDQTSRLSPHLHFGEIGPRQIWHDLQHRAARSKTPGRLHGTEAFLREIGWREFGMHLLYHFPDTDRLPLNAQFKAFPWKSNARLLKAWQTGQTGFPIVDAGMRQLWKTGWMHNRVRMIVASFLVKDLLISWQEGARWFWDTLVDADLASNTLGWQWTAGCGADAAPYFRIFNPTLQGERFDPMGVYVRRWVPELSNLPGAWIHKPWEAPAHILEQAGVELTKNYPSPVVDHSAAREEALIALAKTKR